MTHVSTEKNPVAEQGSLPRAGANEKDYVYSTNEERFVHEDLGSVIADGELEVGDVYYRGEKTEHDPTEWVCADTIIDWLSERSYDEAAEWAEGYPDVKPEAVQELNGLLGAWLRKYCTPTFFTVEKIEQLTVTAEDME